MEIFSGNTGALDMHQRLDALFSNGWLPAKSIEHMPDEFNAAVVYTRKPESLPGSRRVQSGRQWSLQSPSQ